MFCWHPRYELGHEQFHRGSHLDEREDEAGRLRWPWEDLANVRLWLEVQRGAVETLPLYLYEHGSLLLSTEDPQRSIDPWGWDTTAIGFIYTTHERVTEVLWLNPAWCVREPSRWVRAALRNEVREYALALAG